MERKRNDYSDDVQLAYVLWPDYWTRGYATEAGRAVLQYAFEHIGGLDRVVAFARAGHQRSIRVLEKLGFIPDGQVIDWAKKLCLFYDLPVERWDQAHMH